MAEPDLYTRLRNAIEERLAEAERFLQPSTAIPISAWEDAFTIVRQRAEAEIARHCRADLDRLEEHRPAPAIYFDPRIIPPEAMRFAVVKPLCVGHGALVLDPGALWPCVEIKRLAAVYGIEVT